MHSAENHSVPYPNMNHGPRRGYAALGVWGRRCVRGCLLVAVSAALILCVRTIATELAITKSPTPPGHFLNPLGDPPLRLEDPFVMVQSKKYYLFGTASPSEGFQCYESADLVNWKLDGWAWRKTPLHVAKGELHSPQAFPYQGMFCLVYSGWMPGGNHLALAASTRPEGPYHDLHVPWLSLGDSCTSGDVFIDGNGKPYLTFTRKSTQNGCVAGAIYGVALAKDLSKTLGEPVKLLESVQRWELARRTSYQLNEAPRMFKVGTKYHLIYSANDPDSGERAIGYATADKPLGPFTKSLENPFLSSSPAVGVIAPSHGSPFRSLDRSEWFVVYDCLADPASASAGRLINLDRLLLLPNYRINVQGPTRSPQPLPSSGR